MIRRLLAWLRAWLAVRRDPIARDLYTLPWITSPADALWRAERFRKDTDPYLQSRMVREMDALGLHDAARALLAHHNRNRPTP